MDQNNCIFKIFSLKSESFVLASEVERGFQGLATLFRPHLGEPEVDEAWRLIKWARTLFANHGNGVAYATSGVGGLHKRSQAARLWTDFGRVVEVIERLREEDAYDCTADPRNQLSPRGSPEPGAQVPALAVVVAPPEVPRPGADFKVRVRRIKAHKSRRGSMTILVDWASDLPPMWEKAA